MNSAFIGDALMLWLALRFPSLPLEVFARGALCARDRLPSLPRAGANAEIVACNRQAHAPRRARRHAGRRGLRPSPPTCRVLPRDAAGGTRRARAHRRLGDPVHAGGQHRAARRGAARNRRLAHAVRRLEPPVDAHRAGTGARATPPRSPARRRRSPRSVSRAPACR